MAPRQSVACFGLGALAATFVSNLLQVPTPAPSAGAPHTDSLSGQFPVRS